MYNEPSSHEASATPPHGTSYQYFPVSQWSNEQVLEWLRAVCHENNIDDGNLVGLAECTGHQLCSMSLHQFTELHPLHGSLFFKKFREYREKQQRQEGYQHHHQHHSHLPQSPHPPHHHHHHHHHLHHQPSPPHHLQHPINGTSYHGFLSHHHVAYHNHGHWQDIPHQYQGAESLPHAEGASAPTGAFGGPGQTTGGYQASLPYQYEYDATPLPPPVPHPPMPHPGLMSCPPLSYAGAPSPPTPPTAASPLSPQQGDTRRDRGPKLWEFLLDLLEDPTSNPSIIRWENQEDRTFRLTSPHEVSFRWGQRRPNQNTLPYDYFARALRYHYKTGMLISVPERKLVYKFGRAVFQQRRRGPNTPLPYNPDSPSPADTPAGHHPS